MKIAASTFLRMAALASISALALACSIESECDGPSGKRELWRSEGYGMLWELDGSHFIEYQITSTSRLAMRTGLIEHVDAQSGIVRSATGVPYVHYTIDGDVLHASMFDGTLIRFESRDELDAVPYTEATADPVINFEVLWTLFDEQFAFFPQLGLDWHGVYDTYRPRITATTTRNRSGVGKAGSSRSLVS